ncbi:MAG: hypothetical protein ACI4QN_01050 [Candidatus Coproplasma sp.]
MKTNLRRIFKSVFSLVVALCLTVPFAVAVFSSGGRTIPAAAEDETVTVSIRAKDEREVYGVKIAMFDSLNKVYFYIEADKAPAQPITVYYRTRNCSALAEAGDYAPVNDSVTLTAETPSVLLSVETFNTGVVTGITKIVSMQQVTNSLANTFYIEIYKVEGKNAQISETAKSIEAYRAFSSDKLIELEYMYTGDDVGRYHALIGTTQTWKIVGNDRVRIHYEDSPVYTTDFPSWYASYFLDKNLNVYRHNGLGSMYLNLTGEIDERGYHDEYVYTQITTSSGENVLSLATKGSFDYTRIDSDYHVSAISGKAAPKGYKSGTASYDETGYIINPTGESPKVWFKVPDDATGLSFKAYCQESNGWTNRYIRDFNSNLIVLDVTAPKIENWYSDTEVKNEGDKLKVYVRFSEPISFVKSKGVPVLKCMLNSNSNFPVELTYAAGNYTDTLCFEIPVKDIPYTGRFTSITINEITNIDNIRDFAYFQNGACGNAFTGSVYARMSISVDNTTPKISTSCQTEDKILTAHTVNVSFESLSGGTLYYSWTDYPEYPQTYENMIESVKDSQTLRIVGEDFNGEKYLHLKVVSDYGREYSTYVGPFKYDNALPSISVTNGNGSNRVVKEIGVKLTDYPLETCSGISELKMFILESPDDKRPTEKTILSLTKNFPASYETTIYINADDLEIGVDDTKDIWVYFTATDALGHTVTSRLYKYMFDTHDLFASSLAVSDNQGIKSFTAADGTIGVFLPTEGENAGKVSFDIYNVDEISASVVPQVHSLYRINGEDLYDDTVYSEVNISEEQAGIRLTLDNPEAGYYELTMKIAYAGEIGIVNKYSQVYRLYISNGGEETQNYTKINDGTVLTNRVYQLSTTYPYLYYMDTTNSVQRVYYGSGETILPATFSTYDNAYEYVYFNELKDLYAIKLNATFAAMLENNSSDTQKASGETTVAKEGQVWIRYKSSSWTPNSSSIAWVYYYYNDTGNPIINADGLPKLLRDSIAAVTDRICGLGDFVFLTGEGYTDKYGAPYLSPLQMHVQEESFNKTMCGNSFRNAVVYSGDDGLYNSLVTEGGQSYPLSTNAFLTFGKRTKLFYKPYGSSDENYVEIEQLNSDNGLRIGQLLAGHQSAIYTIMEADDNGICEFNVYVDLAVPQLTVRSITYHKGENGERVPYSEDITLYDALDAQSRVFSAGGLTFIDMTDADELAYVAIYKSSGAFVNAYTRNEINEFGVHFEEGDYVVFISDRSGNSYSFTVRVNSSEMNCEIKKVENEYIRITCNRTEEQIARYEVYCDNVLVSSNYSQSATFKSSGVYRIYIRDWYGNEFDETYVFERNLPTVVWKYEKDGATYVYDENTTTEMKIIKTEVGKYFILTSQDLAFSFTDDLGFEFIGNAPEYTNPTGTLTKTVRIKSGDAFTLKIYYNQFPEIYTVYTCAVDKDAPEITVSFDGKGYYFEEAEEVQEKAATASQGDIIAPSTIAYGVEKEAKINVTSGDVVSAEFIKANFTDASGVKSVTVYLDGELYQTSSGGDTLIFSREGEYLIIASDIFGNTTSFKFKKAAVEYAEYFINGEELLLDYECVDYFKLIDGVKTYSKTDYGNESVSIKLKEDAVIYITVTQADGSKSYAAFYLKDGTAYNLYYKVVIDEEGIGRANEVRGEAAFPFADGSAKQDRWYKIIAASSGMPTLWASYDEYGAITFKYELSEGGVQIVEMRMFDDSDNCVPKYIKCALCSEKPVVSFVDEDGNPIDVGEDFKGISGSFKVDGGSVTERIASVSVYYSNINQFDGAKDIYAEGRYYSDDGFYLIEVKDIYGNESRYRIVISNTFAVTGGVVYSDGNGSVYSADYDKTLYSDYRIYFDSYTALSNVMVTKDGLDYSGYAIESGEGSQRLILSENGVYEIVLTDTYGNTVTRLSEINNASFNITEDLLYGYNEAALRRSEGYTNNKLSVNLETAKSEGVAYVAVSYGGITNVLYDALSQNGTVCEESSIPDCVGASGDGVYTVVFRNKYGSISTVTVNFRQTPTLILSRITRSSGETQAYDIELAIKEGMWSNNSLIFASEATQYKFTVGGQSVECPYIINFKTTAEEGTFEYAIAYVDEYGFSYSFTAKLVRRSLQIKLAEGITGQTIDGVLIVRKNISVTYDGSSTCVYTLNGGEEVAYLPGSVLSKDGEYRFTVTDYAGNVAAMTVKKDTAVEYVFTETGSGKTVVNGAVVYSDKVAFSPKNGDSAYIKKVFLDGKLLTDYEDTKFSDSGLWEFILADAVGNEAYFSCRIITHALSSFDYKTPDGYKISEVWYDSGNGVKVSYMQFVEGEGTTCKFTEDGAYSVVAISSVTQDVNAFAFTIDSSAPDVTLFGCEEGETTLNDVTVKGLKVGDTVDIYKDGKLVKSVKILTSTTDAPVINEGGNYKIVVSNEAGVTTELTFTHKHIPNLAGNILIIIVVLALAVALFIGLLYRNRSKADD